MTTSPLRQRAAGTDVATTSDEPQSSIATFIQRMEPEIGRALPRHLDASRMARLALTAVRKDANLAKCNPQSFAGALLTAAAMGLEVGTTGEAYLVPYKGECTLIIGYQGLAKLFWQSPIAKHLDAQTVYERDEFDYAYGLGQYLRHKPAKGNRGDVVCYYAVAELTTGGSAFVVLTPEEVKALRNGQVGTSGRIADPMHWMERKTCLRQLLKMLPRSTTLNMAIDVDEKYGSELYRERVTEVQVEHTQPPQAVAAQALPARPHAEEEEPPPPADEAEDPWGPMTDPQRRKMFAQWGDMGIGSAEDAEVQRNYISDVLGHTIESRGKLTASEARKVIDAQAKTLAEGAS